MTTTLRIDGMSCAHCERAVTAELAKLPSVSEIRVSAAEGTAVFESQAPVARERLAAAVEEAGYELADD